MKYLFFSFVLFLFINTNAQTFTINKNGNKLSMEINGVASTISENADPASVTQYKQSVYYLEKIPANKIMSYNTDTKSYTDLITIGMKSEKGYVVKSEIINMLSDADAGKMYFTTKDDYNNNPIYLTWQYDLSTNKFLVIRDGQVVTVNRNNLVEILFTGRDLGGNYTQKIIYNSFTRQIEKTGNKQYQH